MDYNGDLSLTFDIPNDNIVIGDITDHFNLGITLDSNWKGFIKKIVAPDGSIVYENPVGSNPEDIVYGNGLESAINITIPKTSNGDIQQGNYYIDFEAIKESGGDIVDRILCDKSFSYSYNPVELNLETSYNCVSPLFISEDITEYAIVGYTHSLERTHTVDFPKTGIADYISTNAKVELSAFYTTVQTITLVSELEYESFSNDLFIKDRLALEGDTAVDVNVQCPEDLCYLYTCVRDIYNAYIAAKDNNSHHAAGIKKDLSLATSILILVRDAMECESTLDLKNFSSTILEISKKYRSDGCNPSIGDAVLVKGMYHVDNNTVTVAYADDETGAGFNFNVQTGTRFIGVFEHNKSYTPVQSDYDGLWIEIVSQESGNNPPSTEGLRQIADDTEYTEGETIYNTVNSTTRFYYVDQTFGTGIPFDIATEIAAGNLILTNSDKKFITLEPYVPYAAIGGGPGFSEIIVYPVKSLVLNVNTNEIYRAKVQATNNDPLSNNNIWHKVGGGTLDRDVRNTTGGAVGGIAANEVLLADSTPTERWAKLLEVTQEPSLIAPSFSLSDSGLNFYKVGAVIIFNLTFNFNRGQIRGDLDNGVWNPNLVQDFRAGAAIAYSIDGVNQASNVLSRNVTIVQGINSWTASVQYGAGPQPLNSLGENFGSPLAPGISSIQTATKEGVYPLFATTSSISTATEQSLLSMISANNIQKTLVAESGGNKQFFDIPNAWLSNRAISKVEFFNPVSGSFDPTNQLLTFTQTTTTHTIEGNVVNYTRFTNNGPDRGSVIIKIIF